MTWRKFEDPLDVGIDLEAASPLVFGLVVLCADRKTVRAVQAVEDAGLPAGKRRRVLGLILRAVQDDGLAALARGDKGAALRLRMSEDRLARELRLPEMTR